MKYRKTRALAAMFGLVALAVMLAVPADAQVVGLGSCRTWFEDSFWCQVNGRSGNYSATGSVETYEIDTNFYEVDIFVSTSGVEFPPVVNAASVTITDDDFSECFIGTTSGSEGNICYMTSYDGQFFFDLDAQ
jgi:hypothetical protein